MIASGQTIRRRNFIHPFSERTTSFGMTYGLGPAGYDLRVAENYLLKPGEFHCFSVMERMDMPFDFLGVVHDKSTWARLGLAVQNTVIEPGWRGYLTLELNNQGKRLLEIRAGMPICQVVFHYLDLMTDTPYNGKYQDQKPGPQSARFE